VKVRCIRVLNYKGEAAARSSRLDVGGVYHVLCIWSQQGQVSLRVVGKEPETPALYRLEMFEVVSSKVPAVWEAFAPRPDCLSISPPEWNQTGFWEDFFDRDPVAAECFERIRAQIVAADP
jgi:hypothetical protein